MKVAMIVFSLFFASLGFSQLKQTKANFRNGNPKKFLATKFFKTSKGVETGKGYVVISFTLNKKGEVINPYLEKFNQKNNALSALLAVQATSKMWNPCLINGLPADKKYKIIFNFSNNTKSLNSNIKKAAKFYKKGKYKKAEKYYQKAINKDMYNPELYLKKAQTEKAQHNDKTFQQDSIKYTQLKDEVLVSLKLGVIAVKRELKMSVRTVNRSGRGSKRHE